MKKYTIMTIILTATMFVLSGCSGKSGKDSKVGTVVPDCGSGNDMGKSVAVRVNNKTIKKTEEGAQVRIWHDPSGEKLACMITGKAEILDN